MRLKTALFLLVCTPGTAFANGFIVNDHGAKATGRADAVTATVKDGSAIVYNPAGLAAEDGANVYVGASVIVPSSNFTEDRTGVTTDAESHIAVTPTLYAHGKVTDELAVGIGFHTPFGSRFSWPVDAPGNDVVRETNLRSFFITPTAAVDLSRWVPGLSVGGGLDIVPATVELSRDIYFGDQVGTAELGGRGFGVGGRIGVQYRPDFFDKVSLGVAYRSRVKLNFNGDADFDAPAPFRSQLPADGTISTSISLPDSVLAGVAFRPLPALELEANLQWMGWSAFDQIDIDLEDGTGVVLDRGYENTTTFRLGAEYGLGSLDALGGLGMDVRAGYAYDPTPIPREKLTVALPDINRHVVSAGTSLLIPTETNRFFVDFGVLWVLPGSRTTSDLPNEPQLKGKYELQAWVTSISFGAKFGGSADDAASNRLLLSGRK